jgi:hypothetical protein
MEAAKNLSVESFKELTSVIDTKKDTVPDKVFGKIAKSAAWRFAVPLSAKDAQSFGEGDVCNIVFPTNNSTRVPMTLEKKIEYESGNGVVCVFYCNRLPDKFSFERCQSVEIEISSATGIYVPRSAIARVDGITGVYVRRGSVVHFRTVDIIYQGVDFCLVAEDSVDRGGYYALGNNELIICEGKNLFDGRILE